MKRSKTNPKGVPAVLAGKNVTVLGAGKVGGAVASLLKQAGIRITAMTTRRGEPVSSTEARTGTPTTTDNAAAARAGDIVFVTTDDESIADVVDVVAAEGGFRPGQLVVHMSGALSLSALAPAQKEGALIGCIHPLQSFALVEGAQERMRGSVFGLTSGSPEAGTLLKALVEALGGSFVEVADEDKPLYHAAAVLASNYLVAIEDAAIRLLAQTGLDERTALRSLLPLARATLDNIESLGTTAALTGPIARGDHETVQSHLHALGRLSADELRLYRALGSCTLALAERRGDLDDETIAKLRESLREGSTNTTYT